MCTATHYASETSAQRNRPFPVSMEVQQGEIKPGAARLLRLGAFKQLRRERSPDPREPTYSPKFRREAKALAA